MKRFAIALLALFTSCGNLTHAMNLRTTYTVDTETGQQVWQLTHPYPDSVNIENYKYKVVHVSVFVDGTQATSDMPTLWCGRLPLSITPGTVVKCEVFKGKKISLQLPEWDFEKGAVGNFSWTVD